MNSENYTVNWNLMADGADGIDSANNATPNKENDEPDVFLTTTNENPDETIASDNKPEDKTPATPVQPEQITKDVEAQKPEEAPEAEITLDDLHAEARKRGLEVSEKSEAKNTRKGMISGILAWFGKKGAHLFGQSDEKKEETADSDAAKPTNWHFGDPIHQWDEESKTFVNVVQHAKNTESAQNAQKAKDNKPEDKTPSAPAQPEQAPTPDQAPKPASSPESNPEKPNEEPETKEFMKQGSDLIDLAMEKIGDSELQRITEFVEVIENTKNYNRESDYRMIIVKRDIEEGNLERLKKHMAIFLDRASS